jgi:hypothetical protein
LVLIPPSARPPAWGSVPIAFVPNLWVGHRQWIAGCGTHYMTEETAILHGLVLAAQDNREAVAETQPIALTVIWAEQAVQSMPAGGSCSRADYGHRALNRRPRQPRPDHRGLGNSLPVATPVKTATNSINGLAKTATAPGGAWVILRRNILVRKAAARDPSFMPLLYVDAAGGVCRHRPGLEQARRRQLDPELHV